MINIDQTSKWNIQEEKSEALCTQINSDCTFIACGLSNGLISLRSPLTGRLSYSLIHSNNKYPVTSIKFYPFESKNFLSVSSDGIIKEWTSKNPNILWEFEEKNIEIYSLDINNNGKNFSIGCNDSSVKLFDYETKKKIIDLNRNEFDLETTKGHCNRVKCVKYHPNDNNLLFSGGWDDTIQIWDIRTNNSIKALFGPHICGDSIDISNNILLTCSWKTNDQIQIWDLRNYNLIRTMKWSLLPEDQQCLIYSAKFHPNGQYFFAGGSGSTQCKVFSMETNTSIGTPLNLNNNIYSISLPLNGNMILFSLNDGTVSSYSLINSN